MSSILIVRLGAKRSALCITMYLCSEGVPSRPRSQTLVSPSTRPRHKRTSASQRCTTVRTLIGKSNAKTHHRRRIGH